MSRTYLSALALAATLTTTGTAQAVDFEIDDSTTVGVFGTFEPKLITETNDVSDDGDPVNGEDQSDFTDEGSIVGFSVDHQVAPNLTVFGVAEFEYASIDGSDNSFEADATFAGFKGDFGKVQAGQFDGVYEDLIIDATEVLEDAEITDENAATEDNMIAYYSPDLNGFSFRGQVRFLGDGDDLSNEDSSEVGLAIAGGYTGENWGVYAGYDDRGSNQVSEFDANGDPIDNSSQLLDEDLFGVSGMYAIGPVEFAAKYAIQDNVDNDPDGDDTTFAALRGTYDYGDGAVHAAVQEVSPDADAADDRTEFTVGVGHSLYDNVEVFAEAGWFDREDDIGDKALVGGVLSF